MLTAIITYSGWFRSLSSLLEKCFFQSVHPKHSTNFFSHLILLLFPSYNYPLFTYSIFQTLAVDSLMDHENNLEMSQDEA